MRPPLADLQATTGNTSADVLRNCLMFRLHSSRQSDQNTVSYALAQLLLRASSLPYSYCCRQLNLIDSFNVLLSHFYRDVKLRIPTFHPVQASRRGGIWPSEKSNFGCETVYTAELQSKTTVRCSSGRSRNCRNPSAASPAGRSVVRSGRTSSAPVSNSRAAR